MKSFASDNYSGIHPEIFEAIQRANTQHQISYGDDIFTEEANRIFEKTFGKVDVLYTFNGTGANVTCLKCSTLPFQAVVCSEYAHILADECGAPTQSIGCSLLPIKTLDGKLLMSLHSHTDIDGKYRRIPHFFEVDISADKLVVGKAYVP